ncbi:MAG TPA: CBS domain-containing protein [Candidatus Pullichristensenella excrementigallinarum]|uniref:CBS domain-containing protein n=1 Tax=Candidatus Pullichristensenella excrementigallinarum TaxID=2840907 RepID=A0A9D1IB64_9FIRM|nr:CBS domain-containing protein [Candidatus Pullichristensenella excrementigallinarum]
MRAETFLQLYRVLEGLLEQKYADHRNGNSSVVMEYLGDPESLPVRGELNLCRELRNLLTHNADPEGNPVAEPSKAMLDSLYAIIDYVQKPQPALRYATPGEQVLRAHWGDPALELMRRMERNGFSHAPVIGKRGLEGVFSVRSVFLYVLERGNVGPETKVRDFGDLLALDRPGTKYLLLPEDASYHDVRDAFEKYEEKNRRLAAVFITHSGKAGEKLLGMLTPWDILGRQ